MKGHKTFFVLALVFVLLLGGAYVLYQRLSAGQAGDNLAVAGSSAQSGESSSSSSSSKPEPSETEKPDGNPQTGDTLPFIMGAVLLTISGAACWLVLRKRVRG